VAVRESSVAKVICDVLHPQAQNLVSAKCCESRASTAIMEIEGWADGLLVKHGMAQYGVSRPLTTSRGPAEGTLGQMGLVDR
jgi:hypothetical protein